jgi:hypothetical protein
MRKYELKNKNKKAEKKATQRIIVVRKPTCIHNKNP